MVMFLGVVFNPAGVNVADILGRFVTRSTSLQASFPVNDTVFDDVVSQRACICNTYNVQWHMHVHGLGEIATISDVTTL